MTVTYHRDMLQGSDEWFAARCGVLTASEMKLILTPKLKVAANDKSRAHVWELAAQRITRHVEPSFMGDDMVRGLQDEVDARELYAEKVAPVEECGFVTNDRWGFTLGYSPDGLVGTDGLIECKGRRQKFQVQTIAEGVPPEEYVLQLQAGLLVSDRSWMDFLSYSAGLPMVCFRVYPDDAVQAAIIEAAEAAEAEIVEKVEKYRDRLVAHDRAFPTERRVEGWEIAL